MTSVAASPAKRVANTDRPASPSSATGIIGRTTCGARLCLVPHSPPGDPGCLQRPHERAIRRHDAIYPRELQKCAGQQCDGDSRDRFRDRWCCNSSHNDCRGPVAVWLRYTAGLLKTIVFAIITASIFASYLVRVYAWRSILGDYGIINSLLPRRRLDAPASAPSLQSAVSSSH